MKVEINLYATLAGYLPDEVKQAGGVMDVEEGLTVDQLMRKLKVPDDYVKLIFIDGQHAGKDSVLRNGNRLGVFPPVGGG